MPAPSMTTGDSAGTIGGDTVKTAFWRIALEAYRAQSVFRSLGDVKWAPQDGPIPSNAVTFTVITAMAVATSALSETTEPTPVNISDSQVTVTLVEQGNAVKTTKKLRLTSFLNMDTAIPREVAANMEESLDIIARNVLVAGTNVLYSGAATSRVSVASTHIMTAANVRRAVAKLRGFNTPTPDGGPFYVGVMHPDVAFDLMSEVGNQAWTAPHAYQDTTQFYQGEVGALAGARIVENANSRNFVDAGVGSTVDVYASIFAGRQALGEGVGESQHLVMNSGVDDLQRFISLGWYYFGGFGRIRENSLVRYESASSIGVNT